MLSKRLFIIWSAYVLPLTLISTGKVYVHLMFQTSLEVGSILGIVVLYIYEVLLGSFISSSVWFFFKDIGRGK